MPIYEYVCGDCRSKFERYVRAWGEPVACPACGSAGVEKQLSRFAMAAGGSGQAGAEAPSGGACCGGACGCGH